VASRTEFKDEGVTQFSRNLSIGQFSWYPVTHVIDCYFFETTRSSGQNNMYQ